MVARRAATTPIPIEALAEHAFVAAALQVHFARLAARLDAAALMPVGDGACPVCGAPPAASSSSAGPAAHGARYCGCALCGTLWNYVRIKCTLCGSTKGIAYQEIEGGGGTVKAETCDVCRGYVKILHSRRTRASTSSPTTSRPSASTCWCASSASGAAASTRSCSGY